MRPIVFCEPLDFRRHFAGSTGTGLDPAYQFSFDQIRPLVGANAKVFEAVPAPGDRTYLLAERFADPKIFPDDDTPGLLTIVAVRGNGTLDRSFGTRGVALTSRVTQHSVLEPPGLLRLDDAGRLYFADGTRVLRFRHNGATDPTFGRGGAAAFAPGTRPVKLCDIAPAADGVYVATTQTVNGMQRFAVQLARGDRVRTVWQATDDLGVPYLNDDGTFIHLDREAATFARSAGGLVLARLESDEEEYPSVDPETGDAETAVGTSRQDVVVTRFDADGRGTDLIRMEAAKYSEHSGAYFGSATLSPSEETLLVQTSQEVLRLNLHARTGRRYALHDIANYANLPSYQLLPDGTVATFANLFDRKDKPYYAIARYLSTGHIERAFANDGELTFRPAALGDRYEDVTQVFLGASGRLYVLATGFFGKVALRRI